MELPNGIELATRASCHKCIHSDLYQNARRLYIDVRLFLACAYAWLQ
uniref:Uncharacterized protein n=1 Tax=Nelumbo nucifera TaxID=4432 RepID=A0A822Z2C8_NELNU|nr:TPA_asm: hypothetical protein HUJ06_008226 [Nelumbo nucifera]